ncbi:hypothetical protein NXS98_04265 [Fontisphaera persica]|uniref:hypothetical protein n=1 Tax=Fontisphaera persica TaxID=2974023 RepID=UPI0024BF7EF3|nr:hypothetical protein [Fontisphaera persica]WCJ60352.1 hypothetical protein NXS98_04265 [Fontisphaera persica]
MNDTDQNRWQEAARRGQLTPEQLAALARQHGWTAAQHEELRQELYLSRVLSEMPPVPVSTNFTHRVLEALDGEPVRRQVTWREWLARHWPRLAVPAAAAAAVALYVGLHQHQDAARRAELAASVQTVATLATAPATAPEGLDMEVWENFDVILRMGAVAADNDLLRMLGSPPSR